MLGAAEIARGVSGALGLLRLDPAAAFQFGASAEAALRSFRVALLVAPLYALWRALSWQNLSSPASGAEIVAAEALNYAVQVMLWPVLSWELARFLGCAERWPRYVAALNWMNLPQIVLALGAAAVSEVAPPLVGAAVEWGLQILLFFWFVAATRLVLDLGWGLSFALLALSFFASQMVQLALHIGLGIRFAG